MTIEGIDENRLMSMIDASHGQVIIPERNGGIPGVMIHTLIVNHTFKYPDTIAVLVPPAAAATASPALLYGFWTRCGIDNVRAFIDTVNFPFGNTFVQQQIIPNTLETWIGGPVGPTVFLRWNSAFESVFVPLADSMNVNVSPNINTLEGRLVAGTLFTKSDSTSTTKAALSGNVTLGTFSAFRDVTQASVPNIGQQTQIKKDSIQSARMEDGVTTVVGPDITTDLGFPYWSKRRWVRNILSEIRSVITTPMPVFVGPPGYAGQWAFITPYLVYSGAWANQPGLLTVQPVSVFGSPRFAVSCTVLPVALTTGTLQIDMVHYMVNLDLSGGTQPGTFNYFTQRETKAMVVTCPNQMTGVPRPGSLNNYVADFEGYLSGLNFPTQSNVLWVGSLLTITNDTTGIISVGNVQIALYGDNEDSSARIIRIDGVAAGQQVITTGQLLAESVPTSSIAPYLKQDRLVTVTSDEYAQLRAYFDSAATQIKRNYISYEWRALKELIRQGKRFTNELVVSNFRSQRKNANKRVHEDDEQ